MCVSVMDGNLYELSEEIKLEKNIKHNIEIVVDRLVVKPGIEKRLTDSMETCSEAGRRPADGGCASDGETLQFSQSFACPDCGISIEEIEPRSFSFNNPFGACPDCYGLGYKMEFDEDLMIPDKILEYRRGSHHGHGLAVLHGQAQLYPVRFWTPWPRNTTLIWIRLMRSYPQEIQDMLIHGTDGQEVKVHYKGQRGEGVYDVAFEGLIKNVERRYRETGSEAMQGRNMRPLCGLRPVRPAAASV